ncbi:MAG: hypothetical protein ACLTYW_11505 [Collinsella sp.]
MRGTHDGQGLLIYYAGFTVLRGMGFETAQANQIWVPSPPASSPSRSTPPPT